MHHSAVCMHCRHGCHRSCQNVPGRQTSVHSPVFPCHADVPADVEAATSSAIEPNVEAGTHRGVVGVDSPSDSGTQSGTTRQQVCRTVDSLPSHRIQCTSNCVSRQTASAVASLPMHLTLFAQWLSCTYHAVTMSAYKSYLQQSVQLWGC